MPFEDPLLPRDDVSVIGAEDIYLGALNTARNAANLWPGSTAKTDTELKNLFGSMPFVPSNVGTPTGNFGIDASGPVRLNPFRADPGFGGLGEFDLNFGSSFGGGPFGLPSGGLAGGGMTNVPNSGQPVQLAPFKVPAGKDTTLFPSNLVALGYDPSGNVITGTQPSITPDGTVVLPPFKKSNKTDEIDTNLDVTTPKPNWFLDYLNKTGAFAGGSLPKYTVRAKDEPADQNVYIPDPNRFYYKPDGTLVDTLNIPSTKSPGQLPTPSPVPSSKSPGASTAGGGGGDTTVTGTKAMTERDFAKELGITLAGLQQYKPELLGMYKDLYQSFMPKGLTAAETSSLAQMQADEAKLNRLRQGILSLEDIRTATQGAREAYGARGQVFAPGAIGAEILNREAIRQQREDQARAAYQQSMGNVLNVSNLQTGNIFQPISSLLSGTFNPLGAYPADVYGTNVNAALARDIAQKNYEAALESAKISGAAQSSAAKTSAAGDIGGALLGAALPKLIPAIFCWVAREVYGEHNPRWQMFRHWMLTRAPRWFFRLYLRHGEKFAKWLKRNPWLKPMIRRWMDSRIESMRPNQALKEAF